MPRTRNINKTSLKRKGKDVFFRMSYTVDRKNGRESEAKKATLIKEVMAIIERYNLSILSVLEEHPFMKNETTPPSSPPQEKLIIEEPETPLPVSTTSTTIDLVTPPNSDDEEGEEEDDLGYAPKKKVSLECEEPLNEEENPLDAIIFNVDNLCHMQARCKLQIAKLEEDQKQFNEELKELWVNYRSHAPCYIKNDFEKLREKVKGHNCPGVYNCNTCAEWDVACNRPKSPPTSPPTPPTQEIE